MFYEEGLHRWSKPTMDSLPALSRIYREKKRASSVMIIILGFLALKRVFSSWGKILYCDHTLLVGVYTTQKSGLDVRNELPHWNANIVGTKRKKTSSQDRQKFYPPTLPQKHLTRENFIWYFSNQFQQKQNFKYLLFSIYNPTPRRPSSSQVCF